MGTGYGWAMDGVMGQTARWSRDRVTYWTGAGEGSRGEKSRGRVVTERKICDGAFDWYAGEQQSHLHEYP